MTTIEAVNNILIYTIVTGSSISTKVTIMEKFTADEYTLEVYQNGTLSVDMATVFVALNIFLSIVASLGNGLILVALHKVSSLHPPTKLLFQCLAVIDIFVGLVSLPLRAIFYLPYITAVNMKTFQYVPDITRVLGFGFGISSASISTAISVDRLLALLLGLRYRQVVTLRRIGAAIVCCLFLSVVIGFLYVFFSDKLYSLAFAVGVCTLSAIISVFCYVKIYVTLRQHQAQVHSLVGQGQPNGAGEIPLNITRYKKTVASIAWIQLSLAVCYLPFGIVFFKKFVFGLSNNTSQISWFFAITLMHSSSSLNPLLYSWKIPDVQQALKDTIKQFCSL